MSCQVVTRRNLLKKADAVSSVLRRCALFCLTGVALLHWCHISPHRAVKHQHITRLRIRQHNIHKIIKTVDVTTFGSCRLNNTTVHVHG